MNNALLQEITTTFGSDAALGKSDIAKDRVEDWMTSDDLEVLGALHAFLSKGRNLDRIKPSFSRDELGAFSMRYFGRCLRENREGDWAHSRYGAARDVSSWFAGLWRRGPDERVLVEEIKTWLGAMYKSADSELKRCIVDGALEHMLEEKAVQTFFADWKADPELAIAFAEASEWSERKP